MSDTAPPIPVVIIEGPTASGKSRLALELAAVLNTEIISADSRQVYRYLDIGTAKPTRAELGIIPHHLIDIVTPDQSFNAGIFRKQALEVIHKLNAAGKIPIVCGGTGLYIKALLEGLFEIPEADEVIRQQMTDELLTKGLDAMYAELQQVDPEAAINISINDKQRILRALEVFRFTDKPISVHWREQSGQNILRAYRIMLDSERSELYNRIDSRIIEMLQKGLLDEIISVQKDGYDWNAPGFNSVGYKEFKPYLEGTDNLTACTEKAQQHTRNYAKRQFTWYKKCIFDLAKPYSGISISNVRHEIECFSGVY